MNPRSRRARGRPPRRRQRVEALWIAGVVLDRAEGNVAMAPFAVASDAGRALVRAAQAVRVLNRLVAAPAPPGWPRMHADRVSAAMAAQVRSDLEDRALQHPLPEGRQAARIGLGLNPEVERLPMPDDVPSKPAPRGCPAGELVPLDIVMDPLTAARKPLDDRRH